MLPVPAAGSPPGTEAADTAPRELLHLLLTKDPPDEFHVGAKFLSCIPFPFITIRTDKLEVSMAMCMLMFMQLAYPCARHTGRLIDHAFTDCGPCLLLNDPRVT